MSPLTMSTAASSSAVMIWARRRASVPRSNDVTDAPSRTSVRTVQAPMQPIAPVTRNRSPVPLTRRPPPAARPGPRTRSRPRPGTGCVSCPMPSIDTVTTSPSREQHRRVAEDPDAARRPGRDHVAGLERERHRAVADDRRDAEVHLRGAGVLQDLVVHPALDLERLRVRDLVGGHERRAHRAERVERLAARPLAVAELDVARRHVVEARVAEDVVEGVRLRHPARGRPDDDGQLGLVVDLRRQAGVPADVRAGPDDRRSATWRRSAARAAGRRPPRRHGRGSCGRSRRPCPGRPTGARRSASTTGRPSRRMRSASCAAASAARASRPPRSRASIVVGPSATRSAAGSQRSPAWTPRRVSDPARTEISRKTLAPVQYTDPWPTD